MLLMLNMRKILIWINVENLNYFIKNYVGEELLNPFITYPDLKDFMKKYTFKNDTMNESDLQNFLATLFVLEIQK